MFEWFKKDKDKDKDDIKYEEYLSDEYSSDDWSSDSSSDSEIKNIPPVQISRQKFLRDILTTVPRYNTEEYLSDEYSSDDWSSDSSSDSEIIKIKNIPPVQISRQKFLRDILTTVPRYNNEDDFEAKCKFDENAESNLLTSPYQFTDTPYNSPVHYDLLDNNSDSSSEEYFQIPLEKSNIKWYKWYNKNYSDKELNKSDNESSEVYVKNPIYKNKESVNNDSSMPSLIDSSEDSNNFSSMPSLIDISNEDSKDISLIDSSEDSMPSLIDSSNEDSKDMHSLIDSSNEDSNDISLIDSSNEDSNDISLIYSSEDYLSMHDEGYLELYIGPMFSGKSSCILLKITQMADMGFNVLYINHIDDVRISESSDNIVSTHNSQYKSLSPLINTIKTSSLHNINVRDYQYIAVDEGQFFNDLYESVIIWITELGKNVMIASLDGDVYRRKFGQILDLIPYADKVKKLTAYCDICRENCGIIKIAPFTGRICDSNEAKIIGGRDMYIAMCRECHDIYLSVN